MPMTDAAALARALKGSGRTIAVAESLTCGALASTIGAAEDASEWFRGGVVAYTDDVKFDVLGVSPGPVVTARCAEEMAAGVRSLLRADLAISATGVGGPGPTEGRPAGTVFLGVAIGERVWSVEEHFPGDPEQVLEATIRRAIELAIGSLTG